MPSYLVLGTFNIEEAYAGYGMSYTKPTKKVLGIVEAANPNEVYDFAKSKDWNVSDVQLLDIIPRFTLV